MDLAAVLGDVRGFLDRGQIPFAVVGALALHAYGYSCATNDVDLLVGADARDKILAEARPASLGGLSVAVPKPEHLAAMKIHAMKNDPSRVFQEMADIQFLMRLPGVDREQIRHYCDESGQMERFHELERSL